MGMNRRQFIERSALAALGVTFFHPFTGRRAAWGQQPISGDKVLVLVNMFGGNDGLNTIIPLEDEQYRLYSARRPTIKYAIEQLEATRIPGYEKDLAFNPGMASLHGLYSGGRVAVVTGAAVPQLSAASGFFDHEASQQNFQTGSVRGTGLVNPPVSVWGQYLNTQVNLPSDIALGVDFGGGGLTLSGPDERGYAEPLTLARLGLPLELSPADALQRTASYRSILGITGGLAPVGERNRSLRQSTESLDRALSDIDTGYVPRATYPPTPFARSLRNCAALINADRRVLGLAVGTGSLGSFDTHGSQQALTLDPITQTEMPYHQLLLRNVSDGIAAFHQDLQAHGHGDRVVTIVFSEFGRRPEENGGLGTDHGYAGPVFAIGPVKGGIYGDAERGILYPRLDHLTFFDNLEMLNDFRAIYATVLESHFGRGSDEIDAWFAPDGGVGRVPIFG